jgi:hypothetical protein
MEKRLKNMLGDEMNGLGIPGGYGDPETEPTGGNLQNILSAWKNDVSMIPQQSRYKYGLKTAELNDETTGPLKNLLDTLLPPKNGGTNFGGQFDNPGDEISRMQELVNQGLWKILLKDKKDVDENDVNFIQSVNKLIAKPTIREDEEGMGKNRYYFDPAMYLHKKGILKSSNG